MSEPSVTHATFVIERSYPKAPGRVFAAFADPDKKRRWFAEGGASAGPVGRQRAVAYHEEGGLAVAWARCAGPPPGRPRSIALRRGAGGCNL